MNTRTELALLNLERAVHEDLDFTDSIQTNLELEAVLKRHSFTERRRSLGPEIRNSSRKQGL